MIDRPIRPMFPEGYVNETQITATVLSIDREASPEIAALFGSSLAISDIPFDEPVAGVYAYSDKLKNTQSAKKKGRITSIFLKFFFILKYLFF